MSLYFLGQIGSDGYLVDEPRLSKNATDALEKIIDVEKAKLRSGNSDKLLAQAAAKQFGSLTELESAIAQGLNLKQIIEAKKYRDSVDRISTTQTWTYLESDIKWREVARIFAIVNTVVAILVAGLVLAVAWTLDGFRSKKY